MKDFQEEMKELYASYHLHQDEEAIYDEFQFGEIHRIIRWTWTHLCAYLGVNRYHPIHKWDVEKVPLYVRDTLVKIDNSWWDGCRPDMIYFGWSYSRTGDVCLGVNGGTHIHDPYNVRVYANKMTFELAKLMAIAERTHEDVSDIVEVKVRIPLHRLPLNTPNARESAMDYALDTLRNAECEVIWGDVSSLPSPILCKVVVLDGDGLADDSLDTCYVMSLDDKDEAIDLVLMYTGITVEELMGRTIRIIAPNKQYKDYKFTG